VRIPRSPAAVSTTGSAVAPVLPPPQSPPPSAPPGASRTVGRAAGPTVTRQRVTAATIPAATLMKRRWALALLVLVLGAGVAVRGLARAGRGRA
jgi:hypothetical protein